MKEPIFLFLGCKDQLFLMLDRDQEMCRLLLEAKVCDCSVFNVVNCLNLLNLERDCFVFFRMKQQILLLLVRLACKLSN